MILGPDVGYREVARENDYRLPTGEYPFANSDEDLGPLLQKLADPWARLRLRERGWVMLSLTRACQLTPTWQVRYRF
eukprot:2846424-Amphidinium_carterae.1